MATYYVSATTGTDLNNGLAVGSAKATIGAAENLATSAGDIVYIAPGTYRETVSHAYSGTANDRIYFIGDPDCNIFGNTVPQGIVRITATDTDNKGTGASNTRIIDSNNKDYLVWKNVHVDGCTSAITAWNDLNSTTYGVFCDAQTDNMELHNSHIQNFYYGTYRVGYVIDCTMINTEYSVREASIAERVFAISCYVCFYLCDMVRNSIAIGYYGSYNNDMVINSMFPMCLYPNYSTGMSDYIYDSVAGPATYYGFGSPSSATTRQTEVSSSYCLGARYMSRYGHLNGYHWGYISRYMWSSTTNEPYKGVAGDANMSTSGVRFPQSQQTLYSINDMRKMMSGLRPSVLTEGMQGRATTLTEGIIANPHGFTLGGNDSTNNNVNTQYDMEGRTRKDGIARAPYMEDTSLISSSRDLGPFEYTDTFLTGSYSSSLPAITFSKGKYAIPFFISASQTFTASVEMKFVKGNAPGAPHFYRPDIWIQQSLSNSSASLATNQVSSKGLMPSHSAGGMLCYADMTADDQWQKLAVSQSGPPVDTEYELHISNYHSGSSYVIVSNIEVV